LGEFAQNHQICCRMFDIVGNLLLECNISESCGDIS
jgi:hypothetical protein